MLISCSCNPTLNNLSLFWSSQLPHLRLPVSLVFPKACPLHSLLLLYPFSFSPRLSVWTVVSAFSEPACSRKSNFSAVWSRPLLRGSCHPNWLMDSPHIPSLHWDHLRCAHSPLVVLIQYPFPNVPQILLILFSSESLVTQGHTTLLQNFWILQVWKKKKKR